MNTKHTKSKLKVFALAATLAAVCAVQGIAVAQDGSGDKITGPATTLVEGKIPAGTSKGAGSSSSLADEAGSKRTLPGGGPARIDSSGGQGGERREEIDAGARQFSYDQISLPPLKGFRELADAAPIQEMYKELITKQVPVLFQTMMMVENGAGTGFIGSMNAVSGLMSNTVESTELSMKLMDMTDVSGQLKYAYVGRLQSALKNNEEADSWPAALYIASGDEAKGGQGAKAKFQKLDSSKPFDLSTLPAVKASANAGSPKTEVKLGEDMLFNEDPNFVGPPDPKTQFKNQQLKELREEFKKSVGDLTLKIQAEEGDGGKLARRIKIEYDRPEEKDGRWGVERRAYEESEEVWKNLLNLLNKVCEYKKKNENNSKEPTEKTLGAQAVQWTPEMWKGASAPDIVMTENLLQQLFSLSRPSKDLEKIDCNNDYPPGGEVEFPNGVFGEANQNMPDSCQKGEDQKPAPCIRFKVLNKFATIIGTSRALHTYDALKQISERFAKDPATLAMTERLFVELIGDGEIGELIDRNRDDWFSFTLTLAKYMQGQQGGGANFRPDSNNAIPSNRPGVGEASSGGK
jgi:hypothetical protein